MLTPTEVVLNFLDMWDKPGGLDRSFEAYFTAATTWQNVGLSATTGPGEAIAFNRNFAERFGIAAIRVENLAVAETGNKVLTERVDHLLDAKGSTLVSLPVMGVFEIEHGKIMAWRDYFDTQGFASSV